MELFTVSLMSASDEAMGRLQQCIDEEFADLHSDPHIMGELRFEMSPAVQEIRCYADLSRFRLMEHGEMVYRKASVAFAQYILTELEPLLLKAIIRKQFHYEKPEESEAVERYCKTLLYDPAASPEDLLADDPLPIDTERRKMKVATELELFLNQYTRIHLDGFVTFRLSSYWSELREVVAYAVDEYVMDKQYQEFISLLKYFVRMQEVKRPVVNVIHKGDSDFELYDEQFVRLETGPADRIVVDMLESEMNMDDMIVSTLITVSPQQIIIHTRDPHRPVMRTLETIFEQRVQVCVTCEQCGSSFGESVQPVPGISAKTATVRQIRT